MAYNSSAYSGSDYGEYSFNSYAVNYDYAQIPAFMAYHGHGYNQPDYGYDRSLYFSPDYPAMSYPTIAYSATTHSDPKSIEYDPSCGMTQLVISYSTLEFSEPAFDEYDPTPYGGGYDMDQTYGKPLPPSDEICYPRSGSIVPLATLEEVTDEKTTKPQNGSADQVTEDKPQSQDGSRDQPREVEGNSYGTLDLKPHEGEDSEERDRDDDYCSGSGYGSGFDNGYSGGQLDEHERQVPPQYPSGYGLEAVDLCESLFGYWPCLSRMKKRGNYCAEATDGGNLSNHCQENMWKGTADYLFGNPYPYGGRGEAGNSHGGDLVYAYERHYPTQAQYSYRQIDYNDGSW